MASRTKREITPLLKAGNIVGVTGFLAAERTDGYGFPGRLYRRCRLRFSWPVALQTAIGHLDWLAKQDVFITIAPDSFGRRCAPSHPSGKSNYETGNRTPNPVENCWPEMRIFLTENRRRAIIQK